MHAFGNRLRHLSTMMLAILSAIAPLAGCRGGADPPDAGQEKGWFRDVAPTSGLGDFRHETGAQGKKWFPESMGSGGGFVDYDGDGWEDVILMGGGTWDSTRVRALWLFRNGHDGTFTDVTNAAGLADVAAYTLGFAAGDYDNDGDDDLYVTTLGPNLLFRNDDGRFTELGKEAGLAESAAWSSSAIFFDADRDGNLDLYSGNYVAWSPETDLFCSLDGVHKDYCTPEAYLGVPSRFYHNNGDGTFDDWTQEAGMLPAPGKTLGVTVFDFNRDDWPDLVVANDTQPDLLYVNRGDATFEEQGAVSGMAYDENGKARAGMGITTGVVDSTGQETIFVGNFSKEMTSVFHYIGNGLFQDRAAASRVGQTSLRTLTFGLLLSDFDLDGDADLFAANGHVQPEIEHTAEGIAYAEAPQLFMNQGDGTFRDRASESGPDLQKPIVARSAAFADYDHDGDVDVLVTENDGPAHLYRNDMARGGNYLRLHVRGTMSNRNGIGARMVLYAGGRTQHAYVRNASSYLAQSERTVTFGIPRGVTADSLVVHWPSGTVQQFRPLPVDRDLLLTEEAPDAVPIY